MIRQIRKIIRFRFHRAAYTLLWLLGCGLSLFAEYTEYTGSIPEGTQIGLEDFRQVQPVLTASEHSWGRFEPSSWSRWQVITTTHNEQKSTQNVSEIKKVLKSVDRDGVTLQESKVLDYAGRRVESALMTKRYDFFREPIADHQTITPGKPEKLIIDHLIVPCEKRTYVRETPSGRHKTTIWYSTQIYPYIFRVERIHRDSPADQAVPATVISQSTMEVLQSSAFQLRKNRVGTCLIQTIRKIGNMTAVTETFCSRHVPGGIVKETTRELDQTGKETRLIETRLLNYYSASPENKADTELSILSKESPTLLYENSRLLWKRSFPGPLLEKRLERRLEKLPEKRSKPPSD